jgi:hypothetical protein
MSDDRIRFINVLKIISPLLTGFGSVMILLTIWNGREGSVRTIFIIIGCLSTLAGVFLTSVSMGLTKQLQLEKVRKASKK